MSEGNVDPVLNGLLRVKYTVSPDGECMLRALYETEMGSYYCALNKAKLIEMSPLFERGQFLPVAIMETRQPEILSVAPDVVVLRFMYGLPVPCMSADPEAERPTVLLQLEMAVLPDRLTEICLLTTLKRENAEIKRELHEKSLDLDRYRGNQCVYLIFNSGRQDGRECIEEWARYIDFKSEEVSEKFIQAVCDRINPVGDRILGLVRYSQNLRDLLHQNRRRIYSCLARLYTGSTYHSTHAEKCIMVVLDRMRTLCSLEIEPPAAVPDINDNLTLKPLLTIVAANFSRYRKSAGVSKSNWLFKEVENFKKMLIELQDCHE